MENNGIVDFAVFVGLILIIALAVILSEGICLDECRVYRGGIPQGLFVKYELKEWNEDYRLYQSEDGRVHRLQNWKPTEPSDKGDDFEMPFEIGSTILVL